MKDEIKAGYTFEVINKKGNFYGLYKAVGDRIKIKEVITKGWEDNPKVTIDMFHADGKGKGGGYLHFDSIHDGCKLIDPLPVKEVVPEEKSVVKRVSKSEFLSNLKSF